MKSILRLAFIVALTSQSVLAGLAKSEDWDSKLAAGYSLLTQGQIEKSASFFEKKAEKNPSSGACHTAYGRALKRLGKISEAKSEFAKATQVEPNYADGFYEYGSVLESDKQYREAADAFNQYAQLKPDDAARKNGPDRIRFCQDHL